MKMKQWSGWLSACCAAGAWTVAQAIEPPAPVEPPKVEVRVEAVETEVAEDKAEAGKQAEAPAADAGKVEQMPAAGAQAYLGVGGGELPDLLAEHLGLEGGVVVQNLDEEGPAAKAGIGQNDVITRIGGKEVSSMEELRELVSGRKPGEEVEIDYIHRGKAATKKLALGERPVVGAGAGALGADELGNMLQGLPEEQAKRVREAIEQNLKALEGQVQPGGDNGAAQGMPDAMKRLQERIGKAFQGMGQLQLGGGGPMQFNMMSSSSIRLMDDQGSVEMEMKDGGKQVRVRDKEGKVQWEGPYDTDQDKAAVPDDVRERISKLNFDVIEGAQGGGLRMRIGPGGIEPPAPPPPAPKEKVEPKPDDKPAPESEAKPAQ